MIMAAQFESFVHPFTIMSTVPLAAIGVIWALFITGHNLSVVSIIGLIMLVGIAVNNGIVLVDYINNLRRRGMKLNEAIVEAGSIRLRPILMTSLNHHPGAGPHEPGYWRRGGDERFHGGGGNRRDDHFDNFDLDNYTGNLCRFRRFGRQVPPAPRQWGGISKTGLPGTRNNDGEPHPCLDQAEVRPFCLSRKWREIQPSRLCPVV